MFSRTAEYAIRAMVNLAVQPPGKLTSGKAIAHKAQIPVPFLWKILQLLTRRRLIRSFKGVRGGYELALPADQISLLSIFQALELSDSFDRCALGLPECSEEHACAMHNQWKGVRANFLDFLQRNTLSDLAPVLAGPAKTSRRAPRRSPPGNSRDLLSA